MKTKTKLLKLIKTIESKDNLTKTDKLYLNVCRSHLEFFIMEDYFDRIKKLRKWKILTAEHFKEEK